VNRAAHPNQVAGYDFVHDQTTDGRSLKFLTIVDEFSREGLMAHGARSITAIDVIRCLEALIRVHGRPGCLRSDNGPEFVATAVRQVPVRNFVCELFLNNRGTRSLDCQQPS
jgi:transposase InsO family protein